MTLASALKRLNLSDTEFAAAAGLHRTQVWSYRVGKRNPGSTNAQAILTALKRRGIRLNLSDLLHS